MPKFSVTNIPGQDRMLYKSNQSTWAAARDASSGTTASETGDPIFVGTRKTGAGKFTVYRMFLAFDTSQIKEVPVHATLDLSISALTNSGTGFFIVKATTGATGDSDTAFAAGDFNAIDGFSSGNTMGGNATLYGFATIQSLTAGQVRSVSLGIDARRDIASLDEFKIALIASKDYTNTAPSSATIVRTSIDSVDDSTAANRPLLKLVTAKGARKTRKSKGSRGKGFSTRNVNTSSTGGTVANGFDDI